MGKNVEESRGYAVPDTRDTPRRWADGPHKGQLVGRTPVKVRALKLDPIEAEARAEASRLARIGKVGQLEIEADQAQKVADLKLAAYEVARGYLENPWTRPASDIPQSRWPTYALVTVLALLVALQVAAFVLSQRPTLQSSAGGHAPPVPQELSSGEPRKGRVGR